MVSICNDENQEEYLGVYQLNSDLSLMIKYENRLTKSIHWEKDEVISNFVYFNKLFFASTRVPFNGRMKLKVYMFELIYPKDPSLPFNEDTNPSPKLSLLSAPLSFQDFFTME